MRSVSTSLPRAWQSRCSLPCKTRWFGGGVSQKDLAERLGVSTARVSQYLSAHGRNLTLKTLGRIAHALGEDFEFVALYDLRELKAAASARGRSQMREASLPPVLFVAYERDTNPWTDTTANENKFPEKRAA